jgi:hypothetical protein
LGTVHPLAVATFASFVKECLGHPAVVASVSREEFRALPDRERNARKRVNWFAPAVFRSDHRVYEDALHCNLICLDIDDAAQAAPFVKTPAVLAEKLAPYAFAAYTTARSTDEAPRLRVVVSCHEIPVASYAAAVRWVGEHLLGLPSVTSESKVAVQPMFSPTLFRGDDPTDDHPLIIAVPEGPALHLEQVGGLPAVSPSATPPVPTEADPDAAALEFIRPQIDGVTLEDVASALEHLSPDCIYSEWIEVAAALKHQFPEHTLQEEAFRLFDGWSKQGQKYPGAEEIRAKWDSFKTNPKGRVPVTVRTVLRRAADAGWSHAETVANRCYTQTLTWIKTCPTAAELLQQGIPRIASTPLLAQLQKGSLLSALETALRVLKTRVPRAELKASLLRTERLLAQTAAPTITPDAQMPRWARGVCYVASQDEFFQRHTGRVFKPQVVDAYFGVQLMTAHDEASGAPVVRPRDFLLNILKCPRVDEYIYSPANDGETFVSLGHKRAVNIYIPTHPAADPNEAEYAGEIFNDHIDHLIAETEWRKQLVAFFASHVQTPGRKIRWAVLIQGAQGCGKTVLAEAMRAVLGKEHVRSIGAENLFSAFNGWAAGSQLCAIEEIRVAGHNRYEVMNKLKQAVSNDYITVNEKNRREYMIQNVTNYLMFTNHHDSLAITEGDRRYFVLNSPIQCQAQVREMGTTYFDKLWDVVRNKAPALRAWLEAWPIPESFNPDGHAPMTKYLQELAGAAASPLAASMNDIIREGEHPLASNEVVSMVVMRQLLNLPPGVEFNDQAVAAILREMNYTKAGRVMIDGQRHAVWVSRGIVFDDLQREVDKRLAVRSDSLLE